MSWDKEGRERRWGEERDIIYVKRGREVNY